MAIYAQSYHEPLLSPREYLEREHRTDTKSEYEEGVLVAMSGASWEHIVINSNLSLSLGSQLKDKNCVVLSSDLRVRAEKRNRYYYPDTVVVCGKPQFEPNSFDSIVNPTMVIEILSPSTAARDKGVKREVYQSLESLQAYLIVSQDAPRVLLYTRQEGDLWHEVTVVGLESSLEIAALNCILYLSEIYRNVEFSNTPSL